MSLPMHLFAADDGALYDTRVNRWHLGPALRQVYRRSYAEIDTTAQLRATLRAGPYAWPGGYPLYFVTDDGAALSFQTVRDELSQVLPAIQSGKKDGWRVVACLINWEDSDLHDDHTGERIPPAYGDE
jgi:hypothetical protein